MLFRMTHDIIEVLVPEKCIRTQVVDLAVISEDLLFIRSIFRVLKSDLFLPDDRRIHRIDDVKQALILRLDTVRRVDITLQFLLSAGTGKCHDLPAKVFALFQRDESGRRYRIDQQLQLRLFKASGSPEVPVGFALYGYDVHPALHHQIDVAFECLPVGDDPLLLQVVQYFKCIERMLLVRVLVKEFLDEKQSSLHSVRF